MKRNRRPNLLKANPRKATISKRRKRKQVKRPIMTPTKPPQKSKPHLRKPHLQMKKLRLSINGSSGSLTILEDYCDANSNNNLKLEFARVKLLSKTLRGTGNE